MSYNFRHITDMVDNEFDSWELFILREQGKRFESKDCQLSSIQIKREEGIALRGIRNNRLTFSYTFEMGQKAVDALLANANAVFPHTEEDMEVGFPETRKEYPSLDVNDVRGMMLDDQTKIGTLLTMEQAILGYDRRIVATRNCELEQKETEVILVNSQGVDVVAKKTIFTLFALVVAKENDEVSWYDWEWASSFQGLDPERLGLAIAEKAVSFLGAQQIDTGIYDGILTPRATCDLLEIIASSFLAENLYKGKTRLKDKRGELSFSKILKIIDSGVEGIGAFPFDGEGVPSQRNIVVDNGVFVDFLYDAYYGKKFGRVSTGNGVRGGLKSSPRCAPRGLFIPNGEDSVNGFSHDGVIIDELMGTHTANQVTGDFSLGASGYLLSGGIKMPFKGVMFSGNVFELMNNVQRVGNDIKFYGTYGAPSLVVQGLKISGK